jgi:hypothetical protein
MRIFQSHFVLFIDTVKLGSFPGLLLTICWSIVAFSMRDRLAPLPAR